MNRMILVILLMMKKHSKRIDIVGNLTWLALEDNSWRNLIDNAHKRKILHCVGKYMPSLPKRVQT